MFSDAWTVALVSQWARQRCRGVHLHPAAASTYLLKLVSAHQSLAHMTARFPGQFHKKMLGLQPYCLRFLLLGLIHVAWHLTSKVQWTCVLVT